MAEMVTEFNFASDIESELTERLTLLMVPLSFEMLYKE